MTREYRTLARLKFELPTLLTLRSVPYMYPKTTPEAEAPVVEIQVTRVEETLAVVHLTTKARNLNNLIHL